MEWSGARAHSIQPSDDVQHWRTTFETHDNKGGVEYEVLATVLRN